METYEYEEVVKEISELITKCKEEIERTDNKIKAYARKGEDIVSKEINLFLKTWNETSYEVLEKIKDCQETLKEIIYVGVVGHYSHGKSSLINSLVLPKGCKKTIFPTGSGIVTAKVTLLEFCPGNDIERYGYFKEDKEPELVSEEWYERLARTNLDNPYDYFLIKIGYEKTADRDLYKTLSAYKIDIFDTPGLGSVYWKDLSEWKKWSENFDLVLLCIDCNQINENTSAILSESLNLCRDKIILPIVTKWDEWKSGPDYKNISDEHLAQKKAKELLVRWLPQLKDNIEKGIIYFVSSQNYINGKECEPEHQDSFSEQWNVDQVRFALANVVKEQKSKVIRGKRKSENTLTKKRIDTILNSLSSIEEAWNKLIESCDSTLPTFALKIEVISLFDDGVSKFQRELKGYCSALAGELESIVQDGVNTLSDYSKISEKQDEISENIDSCFKKKNQLLVNNYIHKWAEDYIKTSVFMKLKKSVEDEKGKIRVDEIEEEFKKSIERYINKIQNDVISLKPVHYHSIFLKEIALQTIKSIFQTLLKLLWNPQILIIVLIVVVIVSILSWIPVIGSYIRKLILALIILIFPIIFLIVYPYILFKNYKKTKEKVLHDVKEELRNRFNFNSFLNMIRNIISLRYCDDLMEEIKESINDFLDDLQKEEIVKTFKEFRKEMYGLENGIRKQKNIINNIKRS